MAQPECNLPSKMGRPLIAVPVSEVAEQYAAGATLGDLARRHGVSTNTIRNRLIAAGVYEARSPRQQLDAAPRKFVRRELRLAACMGQIVAATGDDAAGNTRAPAEDHPLREFFRYDPDTGILTTIRYQPGSHRPVGTNVGHLTGNQYLSFVFMGRRYYAHRVAWLLVTGAWPAHEIDHINGNKTDNRLCNLRAATHPQNEHNVGLTKRNKSGHKGVSWQARTSNWQAGISVNGKRIFLGLFDSLDEAGAAYRNAAARLHGDFART